MSCRIAATKNMTLAAQATLASDILRVSDRLNLDVKAWRAVLTAVVELVPATWKQVNLGLSDQDKNHFGMHLWLHLPDCTHVLLQEKHRFTFPKSKHDLYGVAPMRSLLFVSMMQVSRLPNCLRLQASVRSWSQGHFRACTSLVLPPSISCIQRISQQCPASRDLEYGPGRATRVI